MGNQETAIEWPQGEKNIHVFWHDKQRDMMTAAPSI
jgi:hypothetical protein